MATPPISNDPHVVYVDNHPSPTSSEDAILSAVVAAVENNKDEDILDEITTQPSILTEQVGLDFRGSSLIRPAYSYIALISMAIESSPQQRATLGEICSYIAERFPYYQKTEDGKWQNSVRHNLSLQDCFTKVNRRTTKNDKGMYWVIKPEAKTMFDVGSFRRRNRKFKDGVQNLPYTRPLANRMKDLKDFGQIALKETKKEKRQNIISNIASIASAEATTNTMNKDMMQISHFNARRDQTRYLLDMERMRKDMQGEAPPLIQYYNGDGYPFFYQQQQQQQQQQQFMISPPLSHMLPPPLPPGPPPPPMPPMFPLQHMLHPPTILPQQFYNAPISCPPFQGQTFYPYQPVIQYYSSGEEIQTAASNEEQQQEVACPSPGTPPPLNIDI